METNKICNIEYLKSISKSEKKFVIEIIQQFLKQTPVAFTEINNCLFTSNWSRL